MGEGGGIEVDVPALGHDLIRSKEFHAVSRRIRICLGGSLATHHLIESHAGSRHGGYSLRGECRDGKGAALISVARNRGERTYPYAISRFIS